MLNWLREHFLAIIIVVALLASFVANRQDSINRDRDQADTLVAGCVQSSTGRALLSSWQQRTAEARRAEGDIDVANDYTAYANGTAASLPAAKLVDDPKVLTDAVKIQTDNGPQFVLTKEAAALVRQGCENQYR